MSSKPGGGALRPLVVVRTGGIVEGFGQGSGAVGRVQRMAQLARGMWELFFVLWLVDQCWERSRMLCSSRERGRLRCAPVTRSSVLSTIALD